MSHQLTIQQKTYVEYKFYSCLNLSFNPIFPDHKKSPTNYQGAMVTTGARRPVHRKDWTKPIFSWKKDVAKNCNMI